ncbi:MAG TPA: glycosyltransferase family 4 protein [Polyangiales bacterium]|jgi:glycosyltransferase involved in cell wall biosynthesis
MRIAYLVSQYPASSHTFIRREVSAVRARGIPIYTFSVRAPSPAERVSDRDKAAYEETFYILPAALSRMLRAHARTLTKRPLAYARTLKLALTHRVPGSKAFAWSLFHFAEAMLLARELERKEIAHVHNHFANSGATVGYLATRYLGLPWSLTLHGISETDYPAGVLLGAKLEAASFAACVSYFGKAQAMRTIAPEHWSKLMIVRCALELSALPPRAARPNASAVRVVCVGRLSPEKGHVGLLEAFAKARARGAAAELVLVGDGPERERIDRAIEALQLQDHVHMRGRLAERETLAEVAASDVLVLASFMEGLPVVLMEGMALGLPVIAPRVAGVPELIEDKVHGLLFTPAKWDELADHLHTLLSDPSLRDRFGRAGQVKVASEFEIDKAVEPLIARWSEAREPSVVVAMTPSVRESA